MSDENKRIESGGPVELRNPEINKAVYEDESVHEREIESVATEVPADSDS
jgi:hypothetical protein